ncbi:M14 family zinc carboxypeptidase [Maricaulis sp.]|uniref:M14 family zinc carboxypeptidase n=1 Tax=Maricaulis sp. TaxID=1486257 RepID=UPI002612116F|nr:M14 family zinc carboxypeptidase [Maricaulis sp.]
MLNWKAAAAGLASLLLASGPAPDAHAEPIDFFQVEGVEYDASVPAPEDRFGFGVGDRPVRHDQLVSYMTEIANGSDRITVETIGYSHQGRPILFFTVTSPENHARIDEIREAHLAQLDPAQPAGDGPSVIWINYGVHGAESSGMDAAIPALYHFAAAQGPEIEQTLEDAVILMTAVFNPDGHSRRVNHVEMFAGSVPVTNPSHEQHNLWTQARVNHYWFDLNRQWLLQTQPESQAWLTQWHRWKPQVSADFHEMGTESTYYFHPGEPLRRNPLIPVRARELTMGIAQRHIEFLDGEGRLYTSEEGFDNFYVGKGSTYPQVNGSLGILFEIGAARGGLIEADRGLVSHGDNVRTQFRTTLTTVQGALDQSAEIAAYQRQFFADALDTARADNTAGYVIAADGDPVRLNYFLDLLERHDIRFYEALRDIRAGGRNFAPGEAYIVPLEQPQYTMIRSMFDRPTEFEENIFYDVSGWTMPLAYDLDYAELSNIPRGMMGEEAQSQPLAQPAPPVSTYGYIVRWSDYYAPRALYRLLDADIRVRIATQPVSINTHDGLMDFTPGTVFIPFMGQDVSREDIHELVSDIAAEDGVPVFSALSGSTPGNTPDLGDGAGFRSIDRPEVLVLFDDGLSLNDAGEVWHQLDHRMHIPVTLRRKDQIGGLDWSRYTHLIIVGGGRTSLGSAQERVEQWVREEGGIIIATRQAARTMQNAFFRDDDEDNGDNGGDGEPAERRDYSTMRLNDAEHVIGGTIFAGDLDTSHPIGFGYMDRFIPLHRNTTIVLDRPENDPFAVVVEYTEDPLLSGYASQRRLDEIAGTPAVVARRAGAGSVILFVDNPNFRATFRGTEKMFLNAIFFGGLMDRPRGDY